MGTEIFDNVVNFFKNIDYDKIMSHTGLFFEQIKKKSVNGSIETTKMMLELYYVMMDEKTSSLNKVIIGGAFAYQFLPNDFMPRDEYGILGLLDNAAVMLLAYKRVKKCVTPEIAKKVEDTLREWSDSINNFTIMKPEDQRV